MDGRKAKVIYPGTNEVIEFRLDGYEELSINRKKAEKHERAGFSISTDPERAKVFESLKEAKAEAKRLTESTNLTARMVRKKHL